MSELTKAEASAIAMADWATRNAVVERIIADRERALRGQIAREIEALIADKWPILARVAIVDCSRIARGDQ